MIHKRLISLFLILFLLIMLLWNANSLVLLNNTVTFVFKLTPHSFLFALFLELLLNFLVCYKMEIFSSLSQR